MPDDFVPSGFDTLTPRTPEAPGNFSEAAPQSPIAPSDLPSTGAGGKPAFRGPSAEPPSIWERFTGNIGAAKRSTLEGASTLAEEKRAATAPIIDEGLAQDASRGNPFAFSQAELFLTTPDQQSAAKEDLLAQRSRMIAYESMQPYAGFTEGAAALMGQIVGGAQSPENLAFFPLRVGSRAWQAAHPFLSDIIAYGLGQAAVQTAIDPARQAAEISAGFRPQYDPTQTAIAAPLGFAFGGGAIVANRFASIVYRSARDAIAGRASGEIPQLSPELQRPVPPRPDPGPIATPEPRGETVQVEPPTQRGTAAAAPEAKPAAPEVPPLPAEVADTSIPAMKRLEAANVAIAERGDWSTNAVAHEAELRTLLAEARGELGPGAPKTSSSFVDGIESGLNRAIEARARMEAAAPAERPAAPVEPAGPAPEELVALRRERDKLLERRDEIELELQTASKAERAGLETELRTVEQQLDANKAAQQPRQQAISPRLKEADAANAANVQQASEARPALGVRGSQPTGAVPPIENLTAAQRRITDSLDMTVRQGVHRGDSSGTYNWSTEIVRLREMRDYPTFAHELGHHIENVVGRPISQLIGANEQTMRAFLGPPSQQYPKKAEAVTEGFAEFIASYVTNRNRALQIDPQFVQNFRNTLQQRAPELLNAIDEAQTAYVRYQNAPSGQVIDADIVTTANKPDKPDYRDPLKRGPVQLFLSNLYTNFVNRQNPVSIAVEALSKAYRDKYNGLIDLPPDKDPATIMQLFSRGGHSGAVMDMTYGVHDWTGNMQPQGPALFSTMRKAMTDPITGEIPMITDAATGKSEPVRLRAFDSYLTSRRAVKEYERYFAGELERPPTGPTIGDHRINIEEKQGMYPDFQVLAEEVYAYQRLLLKKELDAGIRTRESYDELIARPDYVPFYRDMRNITEEFSKAGADNRGKGLLEDLGRRVFQGSDRQIISPTESIMLRTFVVNDHVRQNYAVNALRDLVRKVGGKEGASIAEEIPNTRLRAMDIDVEEALTRRAQNAGFSPDDARDLARQVLANMGPDNRVTLYRSQAIEPGQKPIIFGWDDGERYALQLPDGEFGRQLMEVFDALGPAGSKSWAQAGGVLFDILAASSSTLRAGATGTITFAAKNAVRDSFMQFMLVPEAGMFSTPARVMKGGASYFGSDDFYRMYNVMGGIRGGAAASSIADTRDISFLLQQAGVPKQKILTFGNLKEVVNAMEFSESVGRIGLFRAVYDENIAAGRSPRYAMFDAALKANDFIDYGRFGSKMETTSRLVPFLNANVQGIDKFMRTYGQKMFGEALTVQQQAEKEALRRALLPRVAALAAISAAVTYVYAEDPVYQRIPNQMRSQYWIFRLPFVKAGTYTAASGEKVELPEGMRGAWMLIPKPWEIATVFNLAERAVEFVQGGMDPEALKRFGGSLRYTFSLPNIFDIPAIKTTHELSSNYSEFFQRPIIPDRLQKIAPHLQYTDYTNKFYVAVAQGLNAVWNSKDARDWFRQNIPVVGAALGAAWSPMEAEHLMRGVFGDWPRELGGIAGATRSILSGEAPKVEDVPALRAFLKTSMAGGTPLREFWDQMGQNSGRLTIAANTYKQQIANGDQQAAAVYFKSLYPDQRDYVRLKDSGADPATVALHPLERTRGVVTATRQIADGLRTEGGMATLQDPNKRIKIDRDLRDLVVMSMNEIAAIEARNGLIVQGAAGYKNQPVVPTKPYFDMLEKVAPEVHKELGVRLAMNKVYSIETVQQYWPEMQKRLRMGGDRSELVSDLKGIGGTAAAQGFELGGTRAGRSMFDSSGMRVRRGKATTPALPGEDVPIGGGGQ